MSKLSVWEEKVMATQRKKGNSIQSYQFHKMAENNQKVWRRGMKERKWKNDDNMEKEIELERVKRRDGDNRACYWDTLTPMDWHSMR